jgi:predicted NAD/FAD-binding protein
VRQVRRVDDGVQVATDQGTETFDQVVMASHSDQTLAVLADPSPAEREVLGAIRYQPNEAVLHTDAQVLPRRQAAWAAWNYERAASAGDESARVCLHYLINRLQPLPFRQPVIVSLNPLGRIRPETVLRRIPYAHPVFDAAAIRAQSRLEALQGRGGVWFCGAWTGYGFHEDGLRSGQTVATQVLERAQEAVA